MLFNKCIALFLIFLICSISVAVSEETDDKTFIFPKYPEQPTHSDFAAASNECPPLCPIGYLDEGVSCIGPDCTRICSIMACSDSGSIVFNDYSNRMPEWNDRTYDYEDEGPGFTLQSGKCYRLDYISSKSTDSSDSSECYDLYTDDDYKSEDYDMDCKGEDIDAYAGIGFVGSKKSGTWLRTIPGSTQNTDYGYIGKVDNSYWKYRYITYYGRDASPDNSGSDAGSWDSFNNEICDEAGTQTVYCAPSYESCALWGKNKCGYNCAGETTRPFIVMGVYGGDNNDLGDALDDNWNCGDIDDNNFFAQSNNYQVTEYNLEKKYSNTQAQCCISHHTSNCFDDNTYWYDSCGKLEDKKEDCQKFCTPWGSNYCKENGVYHQRTCYDTGCSAGSCYANPYTDEDKLASCTQGCSGGSCISCTPNN
ncbi:MAG TPA: hypothetical protein VFF28_00815, partial [Candidatus Nanoarchaeia archaeon]|nr:hypothetical protein [Candidatus Nanoarchaeia archaeon]